jgi:hypothetical protein
MVVLSNFYFFITFFVLYTYTALLSVNRTPIFCASYKLLDFRARNQKNDPDTREFPPVNFTQYLPIAALSVQKSIVPNCLLYTDPRVNYWLENK